MIITPQLRKVAAIGEISHEGDIIHGRRSLPPIVPRIDGPTHAALVSAMSSPVDLRRLEYLERAVPAYERSIKTIDQRAAKVMARELAQLRQKAKACDAEGAALQVRNMALIRGFQRIEAAGKTLTATTVPLVMSARPGDFTPRYRQDGWRAGGHDNGIYLGVYQIALQADSSEFPNCVKIYRKESRETGAACYNVHPHVRSHGSPVCWGSFAAPVSAAIEERQFDAVLQLLMLHLTCFNTAHAFAQLHTFAPGGENHVEPPDSLVRGTQPKGC